MDNLFNDIKKEFWTTLYLQKSETKRQQKKAERIYNKNRYWYPKYRFG